MIHPYSFRGKYLSLTRLSIIMEPSTDTSKSGHVRLRTMFCMRKADLFDPASYSDLCHCYIDVSHFFSTTEFRDTQGINTSNSVIYNVKTERKMQQNNSSGEDLIARINHDLRIVS